MMQNCSSISRRVLWVGQRKVIDSVGKPMPTNYELAVDSGLPYLSYVLYLEYGR